MLSDYRVSVCPVVQNKVQGFGEVFKNVHVLTFVCLQNAKGTHDEWYHQLSTFDDN